MKRYGLVWALALTLLLGSCSAPAPVQRVDALPDGAVEVMAYASEGESGGGVVFTTFPLTGEGYFVMEIIHRSGKLGNFALRMVNPQRQSVIAAGDVSQSAVYIGASDTYGPDSQFALETGSCRQLYADIRVYFVGECELPETDISGPLEEPDEEEQAVETVDLPEQLYIRTAASDQEWEGRSGGHSYAFSLEEPRLFQVDVQKTGGDLQLGVRERDTGGYAWDMREIVQSQERYTVRLEPGRYLLEMQAALFRGEIRATCQDPVGLDPFENPGDGGVDEPPADRRSDGGLDEIPDRLPAVGAAVMELTSGGQGSITQSGSFQAAAGEQLALDIRSSLEDGAVDLFLISPGGEEQRIVIGGEDQALRIPLSPGRWAYNCTGFFARGEVAITGLLTAAE